MKRRLDRMATSVAALEGEHNVPFPELFPPSFMLANTKFGAITEMLEAKGVGGPDQFDQLPEGEWNRFVMETTRFESWEQMLGEASELWIATKLKI